jgi:hypothetical protein
VKEEGSNSLVDEEGPKVEERWLRVVDEREEGWLTRGGRMVNEREKGPNS